MREQQYSLACMQSDISPLSDDTELHDDDKSRQQWAYSLSNSDVST